MRLAPDQIQTIQGEARRLLGQEARVWLFGSRTDDAGRGGNINSPWRSIDCSGFWR